MSDYDCVWLEATKNRKRHEIVVIKVNNGKWRGGYLSTAYCPRAGSSPALGQRNTIRVRRLKKVTAGADIWSNTTKLLGGCRTLGWLQKYFFLDMGDDVV